MTFWHDVEDPVQLSTHFSGYVYRLSFRRHRPLKLPLSCKIVNKVGFWPPVCRERDTHISDMHFQIALTSANVAGYGWVPFSEVSDIRWRKKKKEYVVKYKSADNYVGRPKQQTDVEYE